MGRRWLLYIFIYLRLCWVFVAARAFLWLHRTGATLWLRRVGFSLWRLLLLQSMGSKVLGLSSCGAWAQLTRVIFLDQGSNLRPLHWHADSLSLDYWGSPEGSFPLIWALKLYKHLSNVNL